jgi:type IV pilus assembly protein PilX
MSLVMALVFLTILVLAGSSATLNTDLQERMAGNTRNRDLAFQAAEAALRATESTLCASAGTLALYDATHSNDATYWGSFDWVNNGTQGPVLNQVATAPRYVVEKMDPIGGTNYLRVTARGVGGDSNAVVVLQALYTCS